MERIDFDRGGIRIALESDATRSIPWSDVVLVGTRVTDDGSFLDIGLRSAERHSIRRNAEGAQHLWSFLFGIHQTKVRARVLEHRAAESEDADEGRSGWNEARDGRLADEVPVHFGAWERVAPGLTAHMEEFKARHRRLADATPEAGAVIRGADLLVWKHRIPEAKRHHSFPSHEPNPVLCDDLLVCGVSRPSHLIAFAADTGDVRWKLPLNDRFGATHLIPEGSSIIVATHGALHAIDRATGTVQWLFQPPHDGRSSCVSSPSIARNRVYIGDERGFLHAISLETGSPIWSSWINRSVNSQVNQTPLETDGIVIAATNEGKVLGLDAESGVTIWEECLGGICNAGVIPLGHWAAVATWGLVRGAAGTIHLLDSRTGAVEERWSLEGFRIWSMVAAEGNLVVSYDKSIPGRPPGEADPFLAGFCPGGSHWHSPRREGGGGLRWNPGIRRLYESDYHGFTVINPTSGEREHEIILGGDAIITGTPWVTSDRIYFLAGGFGCTAYAIRHP